MDKRKKKTGKRVGAEPLTLFDVPKASSTDMCSPVKVNEGSIYQLLREVLGPAFMSFRGEYSCTAT